MTAPIIPDQNYYSKFGLFRFFSKFINYNFPHSIVTQLKDQLISLSQSSSLPLDCRSLKFMEITTSNILTEKQILYICDSIQTMEDELNLNDNCLHEVLLPFVIIEIFKDKYKFTTEEAVQRIKVQEEKKILFNLNESY